MRDVLHRGAVAWDGGCWCNWWCSLTSNSGAARLPSPANQGVLQKQKLDSGAEKRLHGLCRGIDNRLTLDVKACVENHLSTCGPTHRAEQCVERRIVVPVDGLYPSRPVDVCHRRQLSAMFSSDIRGDDHVREFGHWRDLEPAMYLLDRDRR